MKQTRWLVAWGLVASTATHATGIGIYVATREAPPLSLVVRRIGMGEGTIVVSAARPVQSGASSVELLAPVLHCGANQRCVTNFPPGTRVELVATPAEASTFEGWIGDCAPNADVLRCGLVVASDQTIQARFGKMPGELDVSWELPTDSTPTVPPAAAQKKPAQKQPPTVPPPVELALVALPPPPPKIQLPDLSQPPPPTPPPTPPPDRQRMKSVEVADENEVDKAPDDATHLSDKNRDVSEETIAKQTNLERIETGKQAPSEQSDDRTSPDIGGPEDRIAQLETSEPTTTARVRDLANSGESDKAAGLRRGENGDNGEDGTGPNAGAFAMRGIGGRGSLVKGAGDGKAKGQRGSSGVKLRLTMDDYERVVGKQMSDREVAIAKRKQSTRKGRWEKKMSSLRSEVENFTSAVQTGNQTALKTRADPFAKYMARMHRQIHEIWGFEYLPSLDSKASDHPLNNPKLVTIVEVAINPDGTIFKKGIYRTSGQLEYDVAALTTIEQAGPYEPPPTAIQSVDQRVYARWTFHRDDRMCASDFSDMFILTSIPGGIVPLGEAPPESDLFAMVPGMSRSSDRRKESTTTAGATDNATPALTSSEQSARARAAMDDFAQALRGRNVAQLVALSQVPFRSGSNIVDTGDQLNSAYDQWLTELGAVRSAQNLSAADFLKASPDSKIAADAYLLVLVGQRGRFAVVFSPAGEGYRATQLVRGE